jgi:hypothetical protein
VLVATGASGSVLLVLIAAGATVVVLRRGLRQRRLGIGTPDERITGAWLEFTDALRLAGRAVPAHLAATEAAAYAAQPPVPKPVKPRKLKGGGGVGAPSPGEGVAGTGGRVRPGTAVLDPGKPGAGPVESGGADGTGAVGWRPEDAPDPRGAVPVRAATPPDGYGMPPLDELVSAVNTVGFAPGAADAGQAERAGQQAVAYAGALRAKRSWWRRLWWTLHPGPLRWHRG